MDKNIQTIIDRRLERTAQALRKNYFEAHVIRSREELFAKLSELMPKGTSCSVGGSMTLSELGILDFLKSGDFVYHDRYAEGADVQKVYHDALNCQVYLMSSNAVTEQGELFNMDGRGNRVAALVYGPEKVVVIAGYNKIVPDVAAARARNYSIAAPGNAVRLDNDKVPCFHTGVCVDCKSPGRMCAFELITHNSMVPGRITVLLVNEELGY